MKKLIERIINWWNKPNCEKCNKGQIKYIGDDLTDSFTWFSVYKCNCCGTKYV